MMHEFAAEEIDVGDTTIFVRHGGAGPPVLLLHGFPQTHLMWREVAPTLAHRFTVYCPDLRGYGRSGCPASTPDHASYAKRTMARDMVRVMEQAGHRRFSVVGHDRGGRVAYRLALDHPARVTSLAVLDIVPTALAWANADADFALGYWPWSLLAQSEPLPERVLTTCADAIVDAALGGWGTPLETFAAALRQRYVEALQEPSHAHAICEEFRAAATIDRDHDRHDLERGHHIDCPVLALWAAHGPLDSWYQPSGGALGLWRSLAKHVEGRAVPGGHFFPESEPALTATLLTEHLAAATTTT